MRKIFFLLCFLTAFIQGWGQFSNTISIGGNPTTLSTIGGGFRPNGGLINKSFTDTAAANAAIGINWYPGAQFYNTSTGSIWFRNNADTWVETQFAFNVNQGTRLISGSATYSGVGFDYNVTACVFYILGAPYSSAATTVTLASSDPTLNRKDVIYVDNTGAVGVLTGTLAVNPVKPQVNPLTQLELTFVDIDAGSLTPSTTTTTTIYDEGTEWAGASDVPGIDFLYATNPEQGTYSTYVPAASDGTYVSWQNGSVLDISNYQYLKFWVRLNGALVNSPTAFLTISFYNQATKISQDLIVASGSYGFNAATLNTWQLVVVPISPLVVSSNSFNKVNFVMSGAPASSFQLDNIIIISGAATPPTTTGVWVTNGLNDISANPTASIGTSSNNSFRLFGGGYEQIVLDSLGLNQSSDTAHKQLLWDSTNHKVYWGFQPTVRNLFPLVVVDSSNGNKYNRVDTADANPTSLVTQYDLTTAIGTSSLFPTSGTGTATGGVAGNLNGHALTLSGGAYSLQNGDMWIENTTSGIISIGDIIDQHSTITFNKNVGSKNLIFSTGGSQNMVIDSLGNVGIGTTTPSAKLNIVGDFKINTGSNTAHDSIFSIGKNSNNSYPAFQIKTNSTHTVLSMNANNIGAADSWRMIAGLTADSSINQLYRDFVSHTYGNHKIYNNTSGDVTRSVFEVQHNSDELFMIKPQGSGLNNGIYIGDTAQINSSLFSVSSTTQGVLLPRMTSAQRQSISSPSTGLLVYDTDSLILFQYNGTSWVGIEQSPFINGGASLSATTREPTNVISVTGFNSTIGAGSGNTMHGNNSFMATEQSTIEADCEAVAIVSGSTHYASNTTDTYIGGTGNSAFDTRSTFIFGIGSETSNSSGGALLGGSANRLFGNIGTVETDNGIFAGKNNTIDSSSNNSIILGGQNNTIDTGAINSAIIGGTSNSVSLGKDYVVILGMNSKDATRARTTYVDSLDVSGKVTGSLAGGTGLPISTGVSGLGTGIATALAVNVGTAGAPVVNGGALGTPSSGTLTNCTFPTLNQNTTGSAATLTTARNINGSSFNGSADISTDIKTRAYQALGSTILAQNVDGDLANGVSGAAMNSQRIYYTAVYLPLAATITGVKWIQITAGDYTANNYNGVALFTYSGGTLTKVASSTDDGNIWKATSGTMSSKAFTSTYAASAGLYFVAHMYSSSAQTTAPSLGIIGTASTVNTITDFTNSAKTSALITSQTALPASTQAMSGLTAAATEYKVYLY